MLFFTCDSAIYSPCFKTAKYGAVFGGMGVRIHSKWMDARFLSPRADRESWDRSPPSCSAFVVIRANEKDCLDEENKKAI